MEIRCADCDEVFSRPKPMGRIPRVCPACRQRRDNAVSKRWYVENQDRVIASRRAAHARRTKDDIRAANLKRFGITLEQYDEMLAEQGGVCAICRGTDAHIDRRTKKPRALAVDHCHETGKVRGLLCGNCNRSLGGFNDDAARMRSAAAYVERHRAG